MKWRVMVEVTGEDSAVKQHMIFEGERTGAGQAATLGLSLAEGKATLAGLQRALVMVQVDAHCRGCRRCTHCGTARPLKDHRPRRLVSLFGVVEVRTPRFDPCRCGVACRRSLTPIAEIMPDRCTPEYERILAGTGAAGRVAAVGHRPGGGNDPSTHAPGWSPAQTGGAHPVGPSGAAPDDRQAHLIIDYAAARRRGKLISTATTKSTVQRLPHRRLGANQQMRWSPRRAHRLRPKRVLEPSILSLPGGQAAPEVRFSAPPNSGGGRTSRGVPETAPSSKRGRAGRRSFRGAGYPR